jgi:undecaprenyl-diphosphatase
VVVGLHLSEGFDRYALNGFSAIQNAALDAPMIALTVSGDLTTMFLVGIILTVLRRTRRLGLTVLITIVVISVLLMYVKPLFGRPLPPYQFSPRIPLPENFKLEEDVLGFTHVAYSFPSGHETRAVAFAFIAGYYLTMRYGKIGHVIWAYPILVGVSRSYVFAHHPSDLIASAVLGIIIANICAKLAKLDKVPTAADTKFATKE